MDRIHEKAHDMMAFCSPLRTPSQISLEQLSQPCLPKSTHPVGSSIGASSYINTLLGSPPPPLYLVLGACLPSRPYRFDILLAIDNYEIPGRILLKSVFDLLTLLTDFRASSQLGMPSTLHKILVVWPAF